MGLTDTMRAIVPRRARQALSAALPRPVRDALWRSMHLRQRVRPFPFIVDRGIAAETLNCCIAYNEHGGYCIPLSGTHRISVRHVMGGEAWEPGTIEFVQARCDGGDIVHAGAYFGDFLPAFSRVAATVWAFEPNTESHRCAEITMRINNLENVHLTRAALGDHSGTRALVVGDGALALGGVSHIASREELQHRSGLRMETTPIMAIDEVVPEDRRVSILQLDVEGYEQTALEGALKTIRRCRPALILETLPDEAWNVRNLVPLGYRHEGIVGDNQVLSVRPD